MTHKITQLRLEQMEIELSLANAREHLERLEDRYARVGQELKLALYKDVAGYGENDTPCAPKRTSYTPGIDGELAWVAAYERWERYSKLVASEFPLFDVIEETVSFIVGG